MGICLRLNPVSWQKWFKSVWRKNWCIVTNHVTKRPLRLKISRSCMIFEPVVTSGHFDRLPTTIKKWCSRKGPPYAHVSNFPLVVFMGVLKLSSNCLWCHCKLDTNWPLIQYLCLWASSNSICELKISSGQCLDPFSAALVIHAVEEFSEWRLSPLEILFLHVLFCKGFFKGTSSKFVLVSYNTFL